DTVAELEDAFARARAADRTTVIAIETAPQRWTPGGAFWEVGVAEVSDRAEIAAAHERVLEEKSGQRIGWGAARRRRVASAVPAAAGSHRPARRRPDRPPARRSARRTRRGSGARRGLRRRSRGGRGGSGAAAGTGGRERGGAVRSPRRRRDRDLHEHRRTRG